MTPATTTFADNVLIKRALAGEPECFTVLASRHLPAVRRHVHSLLPKATDPEDLCQDVLLKVWRHLAAFRSQSSFRTWMTRVAINEALQSYRREKCRPTCQVIRDFDTFASLDESPLQSLTRAEARQIIGKTIAKLPVKSRQILILRYFEEMSMQDIAQRIDMSVPAVKTRLFRARRLLQLALEQSNDMGLVQRRNNSATGGVEGSRKAA